MAPKKFTPEFRTQAVRAVIDHSRTVADVAREFNVGPETLRNWVNKYRSEHSEGLPAVSEAEMTELVRLRKEVRDLKAQNEFLGKATAFFAKEYR